MATQEYMERDTVDASGVTWSGSNVTLAVPTLSSEKLSMPLWTAGDISDVLGGLYTTPITHYYLMQGTDTGSVARTWVVEDAPDPTAAQYVGPGAPLTNVHVKHTWSR